MRQSLTEIRPASLQDLNAIRAIAETAFQPFVAEIGKPPAPMVADFAERIETALVLVAGDPVCAYAIALPSRNSWHIENLAVLPEQGRRGVARALVARIEALAIAEGATTLDLYTNIAMRGAQALYLRLGFEEVERREEDGFQRIYYRKPLSRYLAG